MKTIFQLVILVNLALLIGCTSKAPVLNTEQIHNTPIIADHKTLDLQQIPIPNVTKAKDLLGIAYGHTSHGSQIISGMNQLMKKDSRYSFGASNSNNVLTLFDREPRGDLGNPNRHEWERRTRYLLDKGWGDVNVVVWSWCGQVSSASEEDIDLYLNLMQGLEEDYPDVAFVYMTGHLDGSGESGNLNLRNEQIRRFCRNKNKILFDFADIERFDPDGNDFLSNNVDDTCSYIASGKKKNWAQEWCEKKPNQCNDYECAHSKSLNCDRKAVAFWWMVAKIAERVPGY